MLSIYPNKYICQSTEVTGIFMEKIICDINNISFNTKRDYIVEKENSDYPLYIHKDLQECGIWKNIQLFKHCGNENKYFDFITTDNLTVSLKTSVSSSKICPATVGQVNLRNFNLHFGYDLLSKNDYKKLILEDTLIIINMYLKHLFICDILIYINFNQYNAILLENTKQLFFGKETNFSFSKNIENWNESNTCYILTNNNKLSIAEFQVHNNRDCLKCRFHFDNVLKYFSNQMNILHAQVYNLKLKYNISVIKKDKSVMPKEVKVFQTFNYIGSKTNLLNYIGNSIEKYINKDLKDINSFFDPFSGTGVVSYYLLSNGCKNVISNDIQHYAYIVSSVWTTYYINIDKTKQIIKDINELFTNTKVPEQVPENFYIYNNYTEKSVPSRLFFTKSNGYKIDIARQYIESLKDSLTLNEYNLLIKLLLYSATKVSNIASTYGAFLKKYKKSALNDIVLNIDFLSTLVNNSNVKHITYNRDIFELSNIETEVCYIDPPYNSRNYNNNYFVLDSISKYDNMSLRGKTGLRNEENNGAALFCSKIKALTQFEKLLEHINSKYIFISYSSQSILTKDQIVSLMEKKYTNIQCQEQKYPKFKSNKNTKQENLIEYLFCGTNKNF